jgi:hypothetical protein
MSAAGRSCTPAFSPQYYWPQVEVAQVQEQLRLAFARWGLPRRARVDNGKPWGSTGDWPPVLALWLIGLGVEVVWNPPRQPQKNGVVERSQGTAKRWAEPETCHSVAELQARLDDSDALQREAYPYREGRSRIQVWPQLSHSGRGYCQADEAGQWEIGRVLDHLGGYAVVRRVDCSGKVSLYDKLRYVGVGQAGREVSVLFDPHRCEWVFADDAGRQVRSQPAEEIQAGAIRTLWTERPCRSRD